MPTARPSSLPAYLETDAEKWMDEALILAREAGTGGDVPVGCVIVDASGAIVGRGSNRRERDQDPLAHAECIAIAEAAASLSRWRLSDCTLVVTLEPCPMCAGAAVNARIGRIVFGARDAKGGGTVSLYALGSDPRLNHRIDIVEGLREKGCAQLLVDFFRARRRT